MPIRKRTLLFMWLPMIVFCSMIAYAGVASTLVHIVLDDYKEHAGAKTVPNPITDRAVDRIMEWGDKHVGGPFKKGGGDEQATRKVISDLVEPANWWDAVIDAFGTESSISTQQGIPGNSLQPGAHVQVPIKQPQAEQSPSATPDRPLLSVPEPVASHPMSSSGPISQDHSPVPEPSKPQIFLKAGETPLAEVPKAPDIHFNPNPEAATGAPNLPATRQGGSSSDSPKGGMIERSVVPSLPHDVGISPAPAPAPAPPARDPGGRPEGAGGHGGGMMDHGYAGPDHGNAGNIS
jgi:hypothetical protein